MLPKIASALARVLDPIRPIARPGANLKTAHSAEGGEGGHGPLGYSGNELAGGNEENSESDEKKSESPLPEEGSYPPMGSNLNSLPLQPGLTQIILDLSRERRNGGAPASVGSSLTSYETGAKEQKKASRLPKGSMLDRKAG